MNDPEEVREQAIRCTILWRIVENPELRALIGDGPGQTSINRLLELLLDDEDRETE